MGEYETTLLVKPQCFVYKPPPRTEARGYRAKEWNLSAPLWTGRLTIKAKGSTCVIHLENEDGTDFATCPVYADKKGPESVEKVLDSSRYFVLRIEDGSGRAAYIGMGFNERNDAFDFTAALQDHQKYFDQQKELERSAAERAKQPAKDFSLKQGETLTISIPTKKTGATGGGRRRRTEVDDDDDGGLFLPPPPEFDNPPVAQPAQTQQIPQTQNNFGGLDVMGGVGVGGSVGVGVMGGGYPQPNAFGQPQPQPTTPFGSQGFGGMGGGVGVGGGVGGGLGGLGGLGGVGVGVGGGVGGGYGQPAAASPFGQGNVGVGVGVGGGAFGGVAPSPFGAPAQSPFGVGGGVQASPFGVTQTPFGGSAQSPFGNNTAAQTPFGGGVTPQATSAQGPFGGLSQTPFGGQAQPFGQQPASTGAGAMNDWPF